MNEFLTDVDLKDFCAEHVFNPFDLNGTDGEIVLPFMHKSEWTFVFQELLFWRAVFTLMFLGHRLRSINYKANGEALYDSRVERPVSSSLSGGLRFLPVFPRLHSRKHPGGVASMTRDRGYPDWLVLSARLLLQPTCGQVTIGQNIYVWSCSLVAMWRYYSLLLYVLLFS